MKKVFLIRGVSRDLYGGAESYQIQLARILKKNKVHPIIITSSRRLIELAKEQNIETIEAPYIKNQNWSGWKNILLPIYIVWQCRLYFWYKKQIKKYRPFALDIQSRDEWISATIAGKRANVRVFWTDHIDFRSWVFQNIKVKGKNLIGKFIIKLSSIPYRIIAISDFEAEWLRKNVKDFGNLTVIKNGVIDQKDEYKGIKTNKRSFCYVGRLVDYKGIKELIEAFNIVSKKYQDVSLNIYGEGVDMASYRDLARKNKQIVFHGYTDNPLKAISESGIFILPSYYEGLSISLLEATMLQKTIIATSVDGNPEVIINHETGILVSPRRISELASAMDMLVSDSEMADRLAKNARCHYERSFNFTKTVETYFLPLLR